MMTPQILMCSLNQLMLCSLFLWVDVSVYPHFGRSSFDLVAAYRSTSMDLVLSSLAP